MEKKKATVNSIGLINLHTKAISSTTIFREKESTHGLMRGNSVETGTITKCMDMELSLGLMAESTKANILMTKKKVMEFSHGLIIESMTVFGSMANKRDRVFITTKKVKPATENG